MNSPSLNDGIFNLLEVFHMTKTLRKPVTMLLALCMVFTLAVGACADDITSSGGSATSPVNLTTTNEA